MNRTDDARKSSGSEINDALDLVSIKKRAKPESSEIAVSFDVLLLRMFSF